MKAITLLIFLVPLFCHSENSDSTYIRTIKTEYDSLLPENKAKINVKYIRPDGGISNGNDIVLIIDKDTVCYNTSASMIDKAFINTGSHFVTVHSKWWGSTRKQIQFDSQNLVSIEVNFGAIPHRLPEIVYDFNKPVIYLYPEKEQEVEISLNFKGDLTFSYPEYNSSWNCVASPNGKLNFNGELYNYLFWEGESTSELIEVDPSKGFIVNTDSLVDFFQNTLSQIGLKSTEQQDFITYWYPRMKSNEKNFIHFVFNEKYNSIAELDIKPKPDNIIRVFMYWKGINENYLEIKKQEIPAFAREGFTVIEWGGSEIIDNQVY